MKKIISVVLTMIMLLPLVACDKVEVVAVQAEYIGDAVTDIDHEFSKDDFKVYAVYSDDSTAFIDDYEFEIEQMLGGYFYIKFTYEGEENYCYVLCEYDIFGGN